jgi:dynein heavy chain
LQVSHAFRHVPVEKLAEAWASDFSRRSIVDFLEHPDTQTLFFKETKASIEISEFPPKEFGKGKSTIFYVVKLNTAPVSTSRIMQEIIYGDITVDPLEHMATLAQKIYHPIVGSKATGHAWTQTIAKEVRDNFEAFIANVQITQGYVKGVTCLPLPSSHDTDGGHEDQRDHHSHIHALEGAIITWTKQIKNVLKQDPESVFQSQANPGPMAEIEC